MDTTSIRSVATHFTLPLAVATQAIGCVCSSLSGVVAPVHVLVTVNEDFADLILRKIFGDEMAESEYAPDFEDALAEFLTITAAGIVKNLEEEGHTFKMGKPEFTPEMPDNGCAVPLVSTDGNGTLFLAAT